MPSTPCTISRGEISPNTFGVPFLRWPARRHTYLLHVFLVVKSLLQSEFLSGGNSLSVYRARSTGTCCVKAQYHWLAADLAKANANRAAVPWVVIFGHRPMHCNVAAINTTTHAYQERRATSGGAVGQTNYAVEDLLHKHGLDLAFYGSRARPRHSGVAAAG